MAGDERIAFYGTLMLPFPTLDRLGLADRLELLGPCLVPGRLYDLGPYPGLAPGRRPVRGQLFRLLDPAALAVLDGFEGFDPADPAGSEYLRRRLELIEPAGVRAWAYLLNHDPAGLPLIECGDWAAHLAARDQDQDWEGFFASRPTH